MWSQPSHGAVALPALGLSHWKRTLLPQFHAVVLTNVLVGLALVVKEQSTDDERVEGPSSSGKGAKH